MKPKIKSKDLSNNTDIWNAVTTILSENDLLSEDKVKLQSVGISFHPPLIVS